MKSIVKLVSIIAASIMLNACGPSSSPENALAKELAENFLAATHTGKIDEAMAMAHPEFFGSRQPNDWKNYYSMVDEHLGKFESMTLKKGLADEKLTGIFYMYQFNAKYEKGLAKEMVTMIRRVNDDKPLRVFGHRIDSSKLPREE
ncbi:MAG: hypothetical protein OEX00_11820 [Gammaproteobacteria bacterium]|nr:hypothetical protein [Gammaproteobacteria bacterium]MDH5691683.1 hypothetical protein [Gammaproteobacteria bacterium]